MHGAGAGSYQCPRGAADPRIQAAGRRKSPGRQPKPGPGQDARPGSRPGTVRLGPPLAPTLGIWSGLLEVPVPRPPSASSAPLPPAAAPPVVSAPGPRFRPFPTPRAGALAPAGLVVLRPAPPRPAPLSSPAARPACPSRDFAIPGQARPTLGFAPPRALAVPGQAPLFPFGRPARPRPAPRPRHSRAGPAPPLAGPARASQSDRPRPCFRWRRRWRRRASAIRRDPHILGSSVSAAQGRQGGGPQAGGSGTSRGYRSGLAGGRPAIPTRSAEGASGPGGAPWKGCRGRQWAN